MSPEQLSITAICLTVIGLLFQHFVILSGIKERLGRLEVKMDLFWRVIETNVSDMLKSYPTNMEKDILLDKFSRRELNLKEAERLRTILICEMKKEENPAHKLAFVLILTGIEKTLVDLKGINH